MPAFEAWETWNPKVNCPDALGAASASGLTYASPACERCLVPFLAERCLDCNDKVTGSGVRWCGGSDCPPENSQGTVSFRMAQRKRAWGHGSQQVACMMGMCGFLKLLRFERHVACPECSNCHLAAGVR